VRVSGGTRPLLSCLYSGNVLGGDPKLLPSPDAEREYTPGSNHLFDVLRSVLRMTMPSDVTYERAFDVFEFLLGLTYITQQSNGRGWAPVGCFGWRESAEETIREFLEEGGTAEKSWVILRAGIVATDISGFHRVLKTYQSHLDELMKQWFSVSRSPGVFLQAYENGLRESPIGSGWMDAVRA
jgi:hypothetical protein